MILFKNNFLETIVGNLFLLRIFELRHRGMEI